MFGVGRKKPKKTGPIQAGDKENGEGGIVGCYRRGIWAANISGPNVRRD